MGLLRLIVANAVLGVTSVDARAYLEASFDFLKIFSSSLMAMERASACMFFSESQICGSANDILLRRSFEEGNESEIIIAPRSQRQLQTESFLHPFPSAWR
jgi:hypothetical protein